MGIIISERKEMKIQTLTITSHHERTALAGVNLIMMGMRRHKASAEHCG